MKKILIKFPVRERVEKFFKTLEAYYKMCSDEEYIQFMINLDVDDLSMNNAQVLGRLNKYKNLRVCLSDNKNKIEAINANFQEMSKMDFDIILLASDDMIPIVKGYDKIISDEMENNFPDNDGVLWFFDGHKKDLNTLSILGRRYFERFGYIYHPSYSSLCCDNEFMEVSKVLKKQVFIDKCIIEHKHPDYTGYIYDGLMKKNQLKIFDDARILNSRRLTGFRNRRLTIGISVGGGKSPDTLINLLKSQISEQNSMFKEVQILVNSSDKSIEQKRFDLIKRSDCKYICFIDENTNINKDFLQKCLRSISYNEDFYNVEGVEVFKHDSQSDKKNCKLVKGFDKNNKKIISFSLWGNDSMYLNGAIENAKLRSEIYPDWICRYYVDIKVPKNIKESLRKFGSEIIEMNSKSNGYAGLFWRFLVTRDDNVSIFIVRDTDSRINMREACAVREWEQSDKTFHSMRDHPYHNVNVLGGMWGAKRNFLPQFDDILSTSIKSIQKFNHHRGKYFDTDQKFLNDKIWPLVKDTAMVHDDCDRFNQNALKFEFALNENEFVGQQYDEINRIIKPR